MCQPPSNSPSCPAGSGRRKASGRSSKRSRFSPARRAAVRNVILLVNLAWPAVLLIRFLRGRGSFTALERWQTDYLPVYGVWAAIVVIVFTPVFRYI